MILGIYKSLKKVRDLIIKNKRISKCQKSERMIVFMIGKGSKSIGKTEYLLKLKLLFILNTNQKFRKTNSLLLTSLEI